MSLSDPRVSVSNTAIVGERKAAWQAGSSHRDAAPWRCHLMLDLP
ncbi:MAG: hypothetical protein N838_02645 [Thiohalocapsa sp. PB-PSB1]|nr:MAG: hypothetical protein N838_02645 [Thiohalocapsa sp. PB-PSB1]